MVFFVVLSKPILLAALSTKKMFVPPTPRTAIPCGDELGVGIVHSVILFVPVSKIPILFAPFSVNAKTACEAELPTLTADTRSCGTEFGVGTAHSIRVLLSGFNTPTLPFSSVKKRQTATPQNCVPTDAKNGLMS